MAPAMARDKSHVAPAYLTDYWRVAWFAERGVNVYLAGIGQARNIVEAGPADYADNAVVARNLVAGRGYVVDYVAQFYKDYPGITHPAETWPILQPTLIAPFFLLFGPVGWAARLPHLLLLLALAGAV